MLKVRTVWLGSDPAELESPTGARNRKNTSLSQILIILV